MNTPMRFRALDGGSSGVAVKPTATAWSPAGSRAATHDPRWPRIMASLAALRDRGRHAVRIVDADCGAGSLLLHALHHARAIGFTAIEGRGIDGSPALIGRARAAASRQQDAAIGVAFEMADMVAALRDEHELPADIVIWHGPGKQDRSPTMLFAIRAAGSCIIDDAGFSKRNGAAA